MEIYCTSCQKKLQIADTFAGQMIQCPSCGAMFQAPARPASGPLPTPEPLPPPMTEPPAAVPVATAAGTPSPAPTGAAETMRFDTAAPPPINGGLSRSSTFTLRHDITSSIPPAGMLVLFVLSFFTWRYIYTPALDTLNLWELAFSKAWDFVFVIYLLLLIFAIPITVLAFCVDRKILPAPPALQSYLPWAPLVAANLTLAAWLFFLIRYIQFTFFEAPDLASIWMKIAFRLHAVMAAAAFLDLWLRSRARRGLPEPRVTAQW